MVNEIDRDVWGSTRCSVAEEREHDRTTFAKRVVEVPSNMKMRVEYNGDKLTLYAGYAPKGLAEGTDGWLIQEFTYNAFKQVTERNIAYGNWTARAGYTYE